MWRCVVRLWWLFVGCSTVWGGLGRTLDEGSFHSIPIGAPVVGEPWITNVRIVDLDQDGLLDVLVCDGLLNQVSWIRQASSGVFEELPIGGIIGGPVHTEAVDFDQDGDLDVLVASMGIVVPNNERIGAVILLENLGNGVFEQRTLLEAVPRVTYVSAGDFNGNDRLDLVVGMFGFIEGEIRWLENLGDGTFESHSLLHLSGTIKAPLLDANGDGHLDIVALVSQDWEEVHLFENDGSGGFAGRVLYGALDKDFGSSGITVADLDQDGDADIVFTNGDGLDYATPGPRSWHGVQWLENEGDGGFRYRRLASIPGAHSPVVVDLDGDGRMDIVVVSGFNDWTKDTAVSIVALMQDQAGDFAPITLARRPTHLISVDAADMDGDGEPELVTGAFMYYPPFASRSRVTLWDWEEEREAPDE